jgi:putative peptide zinc metalloprotease protein
MLTAHPDDAVSVPRLAEGVRLLGAYDSQGLTKPKFIAQRPDGQVVLLSQLLYITASNLDGSTLDLVATHVSEQSERELNAIEVAYLAETKLAPLGLVAMSATEPAVSAPKAAPILSMAGKAFMPPKAVRAVSWVLRPLFWWPVVVVGLITCVLCDVWAFKTQPVLNSLVLMLLHPQYLLGGFVLLAFATLFHEFGHATACRYAGGKPGAIGAGVYLMFPAFYTDVTDSYRLSRRARLRVDLGGVYFNTLWIIGAAIAYRFRAYPPLLIILAFSNLTIIQQLLPVVRFDGYWVLSDLVGVPDLFSRIKPAVKSMVKLQRPTDLTMKAAIIVSAWVAVIIPTLLFSTYLMIKRMPGTARQSYHTFLHYNGTLTTAFRTHQWTSVALAVLMMGFLLLPAIGISIMLMRTGRSVGQLVYVKMPRPYRPSHMLREPPSVDEEEPYVMTLLRTPHKPIRFQRAYMPPRPLPRERRPTEPGYWPTPPKYDWWEVPPEEQAEWFRYHELGLVPPGQRHYRPLEIIPDPPQDSGLGPSE